MEPLKDKILALVKSKGPILPIAISREVGRDTIFSGAILSELISNKLIKLSHAKIGGSPVYYVQGQEEKLHILYDHLPQKEREAYTLLKQRKFLYDATQPPVIRVALNMIKDFAIPLDIPKGNTTERYWKWYLTPQEEVAAHFKPQNKSKPTQQTLTQQPQQTKPIAKPKALIQTEPSELFTAVKDYVKTNKINIINQEVIRKNREYLLEAEIPSAIGRLPMLIHVKNKKKINDSDLTLSHGKGQSNKQPVILLTNGELTKKAQMYLEKHLKGYLIYKRL